MFAFFFSKFVAFLFGIGVHTFIDTCSKPEPLLLPGSTVVRRVAKAEPCPVLWLAASVISCIL